MSRNVALVAALTQGAAPVAAARAGAQPTTGERLENAALNGAIGSVSSAIWAWTHGEPVKPALLAGFGGGILVSAAKQVAAEEFSGSGLVGRQLSGIGVAIIRRPASDTLLLPLHIGPMLIELAPAGADRVRTRVNLAQTAAIAYYVARPDATFDLEASLSTGAPAFRIPEIAFDTPFGLARGQMVLGAILLGRDEGGAASSQVLRHESIHVMQLDFANAIIGEPIERVLMAAIPGGKEVSRWASLGGVAHVIALALSQALPYEEHPWEREAYRLAGPLDAFHEGSPAPHSTPTVATGDPPLAFDSGQRE